MSSDAGRFHYGTSGWTAHGWVGSFYPCGMKPGEFLSFYASQFSTVEADNTHYAIPSRELARGWHRKTPAEFVLSAMKTDTAVLKRPIANLLAAKKLKTKGQKRGTRHFTK